MTEAASEVPAGCERLHGVVYMRTAKGGFTPLDTVKAKDRMRDELVRSIVGKTEPLSAQIATHRDEVFGDIDAFRQLIAAEYGATIGGEGGNAKLETIDGTMKVELQVSESITFGPELEHAKTLIDAYLTELCSDAHKDLRAIVMNAFRVKKGQYDRAALLGLRQLDITDPRWLNAMQAINDSITPTGSKRYVRVYKRAKPTDAWRPIPLDAATA